MAGLDALLQTVTNSSLQNPVEPYFASAWNYMTDNYTRFTIAMWFSLVLHEVGFFLSPRFLMLRKTISPAGVLWAVRAWLSRTVSAIHAEVQGPAGRCVCEREEGRGVVSVYLDER